VDDNGLVLSILPIIINYVIILIQVYILIGN
jgi:hypothetical protein